MVKHVAENWEEVYGQDERTGRDSVFVTCAYREQSRFWFVCDLETKLIVEAKYWNWSSPDPEGLPACHATSFTYNEDLDDALFDLQMPAGAFLSRQVPSLGRSRRPDCGMVHGGL